jgi:hypothetical protein
MTIQYENALLLTSGRITSGILRQLARLNSEDRLVKNSAVSTVTHVTMTSHTSHHKKQFRTIASFLVF